MLSCFCTLVQATEVQQATFSTTGSYAVCTTRSVKRVGDHPASTTSFQQLHCIMRAVRTSQMLYNSRLLIYFSSSSTASHFYPFPQLPWDFRVKLILLSAIDAVCLFASLFICRYTVFKTGRSFNLKTPFPCVYEKVILPYRKVCESQHYRVFLYEPCKLEALMNSG
jgi:hypothetical protein